MGGESLEGMLFFWRGSGRTIEGVGAWQTSMCQFFLLFPDRRGNGHRCVSFFVVFLLFCFVLFFFV